MVGMVTRSVTATNADGTNEARKFGHPRSPSRQTIEFVVSQIIDRGVVVKGFLGISHPGNDDMNAAFLDSINYRAAWR